MDPKDPKPTPVMGYPSIAETAAYPQPPQSSHCQGFGPSSSLHSNPGYDYGSKGKYTSRASFNEYYYQRPHNPLVVKANSCPSFCCVMLILMMVLVSCMCMMSLIMWFVFGTYIPEFALVGLKVTNLTATNTTITGIWDAGLTVKNSNKDLWMNFEHVRSSIHYKGVMLGLSNLLPFQVPKKTKIGLNVTVGAGPLLGVDNEWVMKDIAEEKSNGGIVTFSLKLALNANFTISKLAYTKEGVRVLCENLRVRFSSEGEGRLAEASKESACLIRLRDTLD